MMEFPRVYVNGLLLHPELDAIHFGWMHMLYQLKILKHEYVEPQLFCYDNEDYVHVRMWSKTDDSVVIMRIK